MMFVLPALSTQLTNTTSLGCSSLYEEDKGTSTFPVSNKHSSVQFDTVCYHVSCVNI